LIREVGEGSLWSTRHDNRFRTYDPSIGRYISADPIGQTGGINVYRYAQSNPTNLIDPDGASAKVVSAVGFGVGGACAAGSWYRSQTSADQTQDAIADLMRLQADIKGWTGLADAIQDTLNDPNACLDAAERANLEATLANIEETIAQLTTLVAQQTQQSMMPDLGGTAIDWALNACAGAGFAIGFGALVVPLP
jgi:RHS repeat-associated protein